MSLPPLLFAQQTSFEHMVIFSVLSCESNTLANVKKTAVQLSPLDENEVVQALDELIEQQLLQKEGSKIVFTPQGFAKGLIAVAHVDSESIDRLMRANAGTAKAPYAGLFAFLLGHDWFVTSSKLLTLFSELTEQSLALCSDSSSWHLNGYMWETMFAQIMMSNWYCLMMERPNKDEFEVALEVLGDWHLNQFDVNFSFDKWCFANKIKSNHLFDSPHFDSAYLSHRNQFRPLESSKISFTHLCDLALVSVLDPSLLPKVKENLTMAFHHMSPLSATYWQQSIDFITASDEVLIQHFENPDRWLASLVTKQTLENKQGQIAWGRMLIESIMAYRLRDNTDVWIGLMTLAKNQVVTTLLESTDNFALAQVAKNALARLVDQETPLIHVASPWQQWLTRIDGVLNTQVASKERLIWQLEPLAMKVDAKIQVKNKRGWSQGRKVALDKFGYKHKELLSPSDTAILSAASYDGMIWGGGSKVTKPVAHALCDADNLYDHNGEQVSFYRDTPLLVWHSVGEELVFEVYPYYSERTCAQPWLYKSDGSVFRFIDAPEQLTEFLEELRARDPHFPATQTAELISVLGDNVHWFDTDEQQGTVKRGECVTEPQLWLAWNGLSLDVAIEYGSQDNSVSWPPGKGAEWESGFDGIWYQRDLANEKRQANLLVKELGLEKSKGFTWQIKGESALEFITQIDGELSAALHWKADSQQVKVIGVDNFSMSINQKQNWFEVDGRVNIDGDLEMDLRQLLAHHRTGFVSSDNSSLTVLISEQLRRQLSLLDSLVNDDHLVDQRMAYPLQKLVESMSANSDDAWDKLVDEWRVKPELDADLLLPLRDYQTESVLWAAHLSQHGFGACLADDMGLGKTLQGLTLLSHYREQGPSLVVCPKSVLTNWQQEAERFTPNLVMIDLEACDDRLAAIKAAGPSDVVVLSYGLVTRLAEALNDIEWNCAVLDEAQQIKNPQAKRSKVVFGLQAAHRFALSGTPVENHLVELWSLFSFLNPGLLGDLKSFRSKYSQAAKQQQDMLRLKALVSPFIMRRTKAEVLTELPAKTEVVHHVELSNKERTAYEAVRKESLANLKSESSRGVVEVFAALTKLRQICCDPSLVFDSMKEETSTKLAEAQSLIEEALDGDHKVLVFSQFVGVLQRFSAQLTESNISFSYLDGKLSTKKRQAAIEAFKDGTNSVFLISLKAGGTGLNLTEADTVIHIDPWWNPAVEDQASDRAYRMGQQKPVTVYRLVTNNTIEEKIIALHHDKRDLADQVLSASSSSKTLDPQQLLGLLEG